MFPFWGSIRFLLRVEAGSCCMETPIAWMTVTDRRVRKEHTGGLGLQLSGRALASDVQDPEFKPSMAVKEKKQHTGLMIWVHGSLSFVSGEALARAGEINSTCPQEPGMCLPGTWIAGIFLQIPEG